MIYENIIIEEADGTVSSIILNHETMDSASDITSEIRQESRNELEGAFLGALLNAYSIHSDNIEESSVISKDEPQRSSKIFSDISFSSHPEIQSIENINIPETNDIKIDEKFEENVVAIKEKGCCNCLFAFSYKRLLSDKGHEDVRRMTSNKPNSASQ